MKICDLYGSGFYYIPGTDTCIKFGGYTSLKIGYFTNNHNVPQVTGTGGAQDRTVSPWATRARANIQMDTRTQTAYGTLRTLTSLHFQNQGQTESFNTARALIQWAGFTFGRAQSYADIFHISGGWSDVQFQAGKETAPNGVNLIAYSFDLRVRLKTSSRIAKLSQHEADGCEFQEGESVAVAVFPVLGEAAAAVEPGNGAFDDPALGQLHEPLGLIGSLDDFGFKTGTDLGERVAENRPLIGAVGKQLHQG